jgi:hypothetical protein
MALGPITFPAGGTNFAFLVREGNGYISREEIVVASGGGILKGGTIISKSATAGPTLNKYIPWATGMTNAAILAEDVDATSADVKRTAFVRMCEVQRAELFFAGTPTEGQKAEAYAVLAANHVVMR